MDALLSHDFKFVGQRVIPTIKAPEVPKQVIPRTAPIQPVPTPKPPQYYQIQPRYYVPMNCGPAG
jgi:hypothetical protein